MYYTKQGSAQELSDEMSESSDSPKQRFIDICIDPDDSIDAVLHEEREWLDIFYYSVELTALNLTYIAETQRDDLFKKTPNKILSEIIAKAIGFFKSDPHYDCRTLI